MAIIPPDRSSLKPIEASTKKIFVHKKVYKEQDSVFQTGAPLVDITDVRQLYGKINKQRRAIFVSEANLSTVASTQSGQTLYLVNFVAKAFKDFRGHMLRSALSKRINVEKSILFNLQPARTWASPRSMFHNIMDASYVSFYNDFIRSNKINEGIIDFDSFMEVFMKYHTIMASEFDLPVTFSGFLGNKTCPIHCSGLVIDLYRFDNNDDVAKNELFLRDIHFEFFKNTAKKFGFVVDKNVPWRLVADLSSIAMKKYMFDFAQNYKTVFNDFYYEAINYDIDLLKEYAIGYYNTLVTSDPRVRITEFCTKQNKTLSTVIDRSTVSLETLDKSLPNTYWLEKYIHLRAAETKSKLEINDFELAKTNIMRMIRVVDTRRIMVYIDNLIQKNSRIDMTVFKQEDWQDFTYTPPPLPGIKAATESEAGATQTQSHVEDPEVFPDDSDSLNTSEAEEETSKSDNSGEVVHEELGKLLF